MKLDQVRSRRSLLAAGLLVAAFGSSQSAAKEQGAKSPAQWEQPFQAGVPQIGKVRLQPLPASRCVKDGYNKCTFSAAVDYDRDGKLDRVRMMEGSNVSAIVVEFAGLPKRRPATVASFKGPWDGGCYIEPSRDYKNAIAFTCPEASAAVFAMRNGKPSVLWLAD